MGLKVVLVNLLTKINGRLNYVNKVKTINNNELILQVEDVLTYLRISRRTYYRLVQKGELVPRIIGGRHYYYADDLKCALEQSKNKGRF